MDYKSKEVIQTVRAGSTNRGLCRRDQDLAREYESSYPLHTHVSRDEIEEVESLIKDGWDINALDDDGCTPLHFASVLSISNHFNIARLVRQGSDINARDTEGGYAPLHYAAAFNPSYRFIREFIEAGADVNIASEIGRTPLHSAAEDNDSIKVYETLLKGKADVNAVDNQGVTPLLLAVTEGRDCTVIRLLLDCGADVSATDKFGRSPLKASTLHDTDQFVMELLERACLERGA